MEKEYIIRLLEELRKRLIIIIVTVFVVAVVCFFFIEEIRQVLMLPGEELEMKLIYLNPSEALMANLRLSFIASGMLTLPILLYQLIALVLAVTRRHRRSAYLLSLAMYVLFALGISFAYFVVFPFALKFFLSFSADDLVAQFSIARYISFATGFLLSFGLVFQLPLVFWFLGSIGLVSTAFLRQNRKYALLVIMIFSAILTPPDVFSQILMAIPLMILYEMGIILVYFSQRKRARQNPDLTA
ncbi:MAG: twin-arginine translocase subunit TatC [Bacillota bacterium]